MNHIEHVWWHSLTLTKINYIFNQHIPALYSHNVFINHQKKTNRFVTMEHFRFIHKFVFTYRVHSIARCQFSEAFIRKSSEYFWSESPFWNPVHLTLWRNIVLVGDVTQLWRHCHCIESVSGGRTQAVDALKTAETCIYRRDDKMECLAKNGKIILQCLFSIHSDGISPSPPEFSGFQLIRILPRTLGGTTMSIGTISRFHSHQELTPENL